MRESHWESLEPSGLSDRLRVPGGWIVRTLTSNGSVVQTLVTDLNHEWKLDGEVTEEIKSDMKPCDNCTKSNPSDANFCNGCGTQFGDAVKICPNCETEYPLSERFCPRDGTALRSPNPPSPKTPG